MPWGGNGVLWAGEGNTMAEGTWEKVWTCRRGKVPLLGKVRGGGGDRHRKPPVPERVCLPTGSSLTGYRW